MAVYELNAELPLAEASRLTGYRIHSIRHTLRRLAEKKIISNKRAFVDLSPLGLYYYSFYFSLSSENQNKKEALINKLSSSPRVLWVLELGSEYQYGISVCARHILEVTSLLNRISLRVGNIFFEKSVCQRLSYTDFGRKYLDPSSILSSPLSYKAAEGVVLTDALDLQIMQLISFNYSSINDVARRLGVGVATVARRKRALEEKGIVKGYYYKVDPQAFGMQLFKLLISVKGINPKLYQSLFEFCKMHSSVSYFIESVGSWDYEVGVEVEMAREVTMVTEDFYDSFGHAISSIKIVPVFGYIKYRGYPEAETLAC